MASWTDDPPKAQPGLNTRKPVDKPAGHMAGIDLLRFGAALAVAFYHLTVAIVAPTDSGIVLGGRAAYPEAYRFAWPGFIGVEIFFVISGVLIAFSAMNQTPWRFLFNRPLRLFPAAWVCLSLSAVVCGILHLYSADKLILRWAKSMLLFRTGIDSVCWTLEVEMVFYFGVFLILLLVLRNTYIDLASQLVLQVQYISSWEPLSVPFSSGIIFSTGWRCCCFPMGFILDWVWFCSCGEIASAS